MRLNEYMDTKNITISTAADELGMPYRTVRNWYLGLRRCPRGPALQKIRSWSGGAVTANDFYGDDEPIAQPPLESIKPRSSTPLSSSSEATP